MTVLWPGASLRPIVPLLRIRGSSRRMSAASLLSVVGVFWILLGASSCVPNHATRFESMIDKERDRVRMEVANHSRWDLRVYLERDGVLFPLGRVNRMRTVTFPIREGMLANARHYALVTESVSGGEGFRTESVAIAPGRLHRWTLLPTAGLFHGVERRHSSGIPGGPLG